MKKTACDHYVYTDEEAAKWYRRVLYFVKDFGPFALILIALCATFGIVVWIEPGIAVFGVLIFFGLLASAGLEPGEAFFYPDRRSLTPLELNDWKVLNARAEHHPDVLALLVAATKHGRTLRVRDFDALYGIVERRREQRRKVLNADKEAADRLSEAAAVAEIQRSLQDAHERAGEKA